MTVISLLSFHDLLTFYSNSCMFPVPSNKVRAVPNFQNTLHYPNHSSASTVTADWSHHAFITQVNETLQHLNKCH